MSPGDLVLVKVLTPVDYWIVEPVHMVGKVYEISDYQPDSDVIWVKVEPGVPARRKSSETKRYVYLHAWPFLPEDLELVSCL